MNAIHSLRYLVTAGVWAACAATAVYWGLRLTSGTLPVPPQAYAGGADTVLRGDAGRLLGVVAASEADADVAAMPGLESRFKLIGVVASTVSPTAGGLALIALDDKPARAYRIGAAIDSGMVLQAVQSREVRIGMPGGPASVVLTLQGLPPAATGTLPSAQSTGGDVPVVVMPPAAPVVAPPVGQDATGTPGAESVAEQAQPPQMPAAVPAQDGIPINSLPRPRRPPVH